MEFTGHLLLDAVEPDATASIPRITSALNHYFPFKTPSINPTNILLTERQIPTVIHHLTTGTPTDQKSALDTYFLPDASFYHPLCRVPSFSHVKLPLVGQIDSRWVIWMVYRWYKILSPRIELDVECGEFNQETGVLFVEIFQVCYPFLPFLFSMSSCTLLE